MSRLRFGHGSVRNKTGFWAADRACRSKASPTVYPIFYKDSKNPFRAVRCRRLFRCSIPCVGHFDLFVELFLRGVEFLVAGRAADGRFGFHEVAAADAGRQDAVTRLRVVVEPSAAMAASDFVSSSHDRLFFLVLRCKGMVVLCHVVTQSKKIVIFRDLPY